MAVTQRRRKGMCLAPAGPLGSLLILPCSALFDSNDKCSCYDLRRARMPRLRPLKGKVWVASSGEPLKSAGVLAEEI